MKPVTMPIDISAKACEASAQLGPSATPRSFPIPGPVPPLLALPYIKNRNNKPYCLLCSCDASPSHMSSDEHSQRAPYWNIILMSIRGKHSGLGFSKGKGKTTKGSRLAEP